MNNSTRYARTTRGPAALTHRRWPAVAAGLSLLLVLGSPSPAMAVERDPTRDDVAQLLGQVRELLASGQADSAFALVISSLGPAPIDGRVRRALVTTCVRAGAPRLGIRAIGDMIRRRPGDVQLHVALGEIELERGRPEVAVRHFQRALLIDDRLSEALGGYARSRARETKSIDAAVNYFDELAQADPGVASVRYGKGVLLSEAGRAEEARGEFRWALGLDEENWLYRRDYARALLALGEREGALGHLEKAVELAGKAGDPVTAWELSAELEAARAAE